MRFIILVTLAIFAFNCGGNDGSSKSLNDINTDGQETSADNIKKDSTLLMSKDTSTWKQQPYENIQWKLNSFAIKGQNLSIKGDESLTLTLAKGKISGYSGCNNFFGTYNQSGDNTIEVLNIASTKKACQGTALGQERRFQGLLREATAIDMDKGQLTIESLQGKLFFSK